MTVRIREVKLDELNWLRRLAMTTYRETFGDHTTEQDLALYFEEDYGLERLEQELNNPESRVFFMLEDQEPVGYLKVNWGQAQTEQELENAFEIQRLYLLKSHQGKGLGKLLFEFGLSLAEQSTCDWVWLGVWEHNYKAQAFYQTYGFEKFSEHAFQAGKQVDVDWLLKKALR